MNTTATEAVATASLPLSLCQRHASLPPFQPNSAAPDSDQAAAAAADAAGAAAARPIAGEWGIGDLTAWMDCAFKGNAVATTSVPISPCQLHSLSPFKPPSAAPDGDQAAAAALGAAGAAAAGQSAVEWGLDDLTAWMDNTLKSQAANAVEAAEPVEADTIATAFETAVAPLLGMAGAGAGAVTGALSYPDALLLATPDLPASWQPYLSDEPGMVGTPPTTHALSLQPDSRPFVEAGSQRPLYPVREKQHLQAPCCTTPGRESQLNASAWKADSVAKPFALGANMSSFMGARGFGFPVGSAVGGVSFSDGSFAGCNGSTGVDMGGVWSLNSSESSSGAPFGAVSTTSAGVVDVSCQLPSGPVTNGLRARGVAADPILFDSRGEVLASALDGMAALPNAAMAGHAAAGTSAATPVPSLPVAADAVGIAAGSAAANAAGNAAHLPRTSPASDGSLGARRPPTGRRSDKERLRRHRVSAGLKRLEKTIPAAWLRRKYPVNLTARTDIASLLNAAVTFIEELEVHKAKLFQIHIQHMAFVSN